MAILSAVLLLMPAALAAGNGGSVGGTIGVEDFPIKVWQCGDRAVRDESVQPWRISGDGDVLQERNNNYLFEGETYEIDVLVMDKNKIDEVEVDVVFEAITTGQDDLILNCAPNQINFTNCNAMIDEEVLDYDSDTMAGYTCYIEVPDSSIAYGEYELYVQATDHDGIQAPAQFDETSIWFLNPMITVDVQGSLAFSGVRPGTYAYSNVQVKNDAEGGVLLDMFIAGEDWDAVDPVQGRCQQVNGAGAEVNGLLNQLSLGAFRYYVENGAFDSRGDAQTDLQNYDAAITRTKDVEGYLNIHRLLNSGFEESMFNEAEILQANPVNGGAAGYLANILYPGSTGMTLTFRLNLPEPCYGNYAAQDGFFIWGEAI